jgi:hypothetical protein
VAVMQQPFTNVRTDEPRPTGDQKVHGQTLTTRGRSVECAGNLAVSYFESSEVFMGFSG